MMTNRTYNFLKWVAQIFLPACGALYFSLSEIWGLPKATEIVGTITVVDFFLGTLLGISSRQYDRSDAKYDGAIEVKEEDGGKTMGLIFNGDPYNLDQQKEVLFKVQHGDELAQ